MQNGIDFRNLTVVQLRAELLKLQTLAVAVGQCSGSELPSKVIEAWQEPSEYRRDELVWLREHYLDLVSVAARVVRLKDSPDELQAAIDRMQVMIIDRA